MLVKVERSQHEEHEEETDGHPQDGGIDIPRRQYGMREHDEQGDTQHQTRNEGHHHLCSGMRQPHQHRQISPRHGGGEDQDGIDNQRDDE